MAHSTLTSGLSPKLPFAERHRRCLVSALSLHIRCYFNHFRRLCQALPPGFLAKICGRTEVSSPLCDNLLTSGLNDHHYIPKRLRRDLGIVVAQIAAAGSRDPDFGCFRRWRSLGYVDMDRLQRVIFIGPEVNPVRTDFKNLRHCRSLPPGQTGE